MAESVGRYNSAAARCLVKVVSVADPDALAPAAATEIASTRKKKDLQFINYVSSVRAVHY